MNTRKNNTRLGTLAMVGGLAMIALVVMGCSTTAAYAEPRAAFPLVSAPAAPRIVQTRPVAVPAAYRSVEAVRAPGSEVCDSRGWKEFINDYRPEPVVGSRSGSVVSTASAKPAAATTSAAATGPRNRGR